MIRKTSRIWTEDSPRTVDFVMDIVIWVLGLTILNTVLIGVLIWFLLQNW